MDVSTNLCYSRRCQARLVKIYVLQFRRYIRDHPGDDFNKNDDICCE